HQRKHFRIDRAVAIIHSDHDRAGPRSRSMSEQEVDKFPQVNHTIAVLGQVVQIRFKVSCCNRRRSCRPRTKTMVNQDWNAQPCGEVHRTGGGRQQQRRHDGGRPLHLSVREQSCCQHSCRQIARKLLPGLAWFHSPLAQIWANRTANSSAANAELVGASGRAGAPPVVEREEFMNRLVLFALSCFVFSPVFAQAPIAGDGNWPREIDAGNVHLVIYQPQVDSWKDNRIEARSAVIVTRQEDPTQIFGIVSINARTEVDRETRLVSFEDITIKDVDFPSAPALRSTLLEAARSNVPNWPRTVSLDRLLADLEITQAEAKAESIRLKNNPPNIIFSQGSAVLILIDGEPVHHPVEGTRYTRVVNTPALLLFDSSAGAFYLDGEQWWMTASTLRGPW